MKYIFIISILLSNIHALGLQNDNYIFTYTIHNPSLGPVSGSKIFTVLIKSNQIQALNLATGNQVAQRDIPHINIILDAINQKSNSNYNIVYDTNNLPKQITSKISSKMIGNSLIIKISAYQVVEDNYVLDSQKLRIEYFEQNHQKWLAFKKKKYFFNYQDSHLKDVYIDGLEVGVENDKVIFLRDTFHYQPIALSEINKVMTINQIFNLIKRRLTDNKNQLTVLYDVQYGYPYYIKNKSEKIEIFLHNLK